MAENIFDQFDQTQPNIFDQFDGPATPEGTGNIPAALEGIGQGLTFGFSDEIEGAGRALYGKLTGDQRPVSDIYGESVKQARDRIKRASETNPWAFYSGEIGSSVAVPGGLARVGIAGPLARSAGQSLGRRSIAGAKEGMAYGATYAAGKSEGGPQQLATDIATGAGTGAALGFAIPGAVDLLSAGAQRIAAPFRGYINPKGVAAEKFSEAVARDVPDEIGGAGRFAARFQEMASANPSARVMDAGGDNVRSLMRAANNMPNPARESARRLVDARQGSQSTRIENELSATLAPGRAFGETVDDLVARRAKDASPAFEKAYSAPFNVGADDDLVKFLGERGYMKRLIEKTDETITGMTGKSAPADLTGKAPKVAPAMESDIAQIRANIGQVDPSEVESILSMHRYVREMERAQKPETLTSFAFRKGGLQDQDGEIMRILGSTRERPALIRKHGQKLDDAALRAYEEGFFAKRPSIDEFLNALDDDAKGIEKVVRSRDYAALDDANVAAQMADDLGRMGITSKIPEDILAQALGKAPAAAPETAKQIRPWEFLHRVKMEIDREISRLKRGVQDSKANWTLRDLYSLKDEFQTLMEKRNKDLGTAMTRYSDQSSLINAAETGAEEFFKMPVHELRKAVGKMKPAEAEMFRLGAARAIMDKIEKSRAVSDKTDNIFATPEIQKRLEAIMPSREMLRKFQKSLVIEAKMADSRKALQGNSTTARQLTEGAEAGKTAGMITSAMNAASGRLEPILNLAAQGYNRFSGLTPNVANELLRLGMSQNPATGQAMAAAALERAATVPALRASLGRAAIGAGASAFTQRPNALLIE